MDDRFERMVAELVRLRRIAEHADMEGLMKAVRQIGPVKEASVTIRAHEHDGGRPGTLREIQDRVWPRTKHD